MHKPLIVANWKMNPASLKEAILLASAAEECAAKVKNVEIVLAPPFPFLGAIKSVIKKSKLGAQDSFWADSGPYTGEVSWKQLAGIGAEYIIIGHSERRIHLGESDELIAKKTDALLKNGMNVILCIGEREREGGDIPIAVGIQLKSALIGVKKNMIKNLIIAYEPVWAISTNAGARPDSPDNAFRATLYIRKILVELYGRTAASAVRIIYGGSVKSANIASFLREGKMEGALVGGASLDPREFAEIVRNAK